MSLHVGQRLSQYRLIEKIGQGGMGVVWRARDTVLERDAALKVLPDAVATDAAQLERLAREARLLATLNHPNVASVFGLHETNSATSSVRFVAMELLSGEDLGKRLARGDLELREKLEAARQVAEALAAAHDHGVIHRDLKPANIQLAADGRVKVLDFGLAKALVSAEGADSADGDSDSPTIVGPSTTTGVVMGTAAYMSPEQARGKPVDRRTDIWSFGCVLFEMLAAVRAFSGETVSDTIVQVLQGEPDWSRLPKETPPSVVRLLRRCLEKNPTRRLHDLGDAILEIDEALGPPSGQIPEQPAVQVPPIRRRRMPHFAIAIVVVLAALAGWAVGQRNRSPLGPAGPITRFTIDDSARWPRAGWDYPALAVSPDGRRIIYQAARADDGVSLVSREISQFQASPVPGVQSTYQTFFSPDGRWLGYFHSNRLWKVSTRGGEPIALTAAPMARGGTWLPDDSIVFTPIPESGLSRVSASGGDARVLTVPDKSKGERTHRWPHALPSGEAVLFTVGLSTITSFDDARIEVLSLKTGERRTLIEHGTFPHYVAGEPFGHLLYVYRGNLMAVPFDAKRLRIAGRDTTILSGILTHPDVGCAQFAASPNGTLVYAEGPSVKPRRQLLWIDREGRSSPVTDRRDGYHTVSISPRGDAVVVDIEGANNHILVHEIARGGRKMLTRDWSQGMPIWSADGDKVTFFSDRGGPGNLYWTAADGSGDLRRLTHSEYKQWPTSWSPDGSNLAYTEQHPVSRADIWLLPVDSNGEPGAPRPLLQTPHTEDEAVFSPDGRWIAFTSFETGRKEVYVTRFPPDGARLPVTGGSGASPSWSPEADELYYLNGATLMAVAVRTEPEFAVLSDPRPIFSPVYRGYAVHPDGERFVIVTREVERPESPVHVIVNGLEELRRLAPGS